MPPQRPSSVAVILVNHQQYADTYLAPCYESLLRQTYPGEQFTVFIVDNGGTPAQRARIQQIAPTARLLANADNAGWSGGNNTAISVALTEGFDHIVLLNMDTVVDAQWLAQLMAMAERRPDLHILQSKILLHGTDRINTLGNRIHFLGYAYCQGYGQPAAACPMPAAVDCVSGAAMLVKRGVFEAVGRFREEYFMYYEDVEFCWRARLAGFSIGIAESSLCYHKYHFKMHAPFLYYLDRNRWMAMLTLLRLRTLLVILPCWIMAELVMSVYWLLHGRLKARVWLLLHFVRPATWRVILHRRREMARCRRRNDAEIVRHFSGVVDFSAIDHGLLHWVANPLLRLYWGAMKRLIIW
ncbi:MAG: glycosyltransferase family 2 protein [Candidatus Omnitrophica bacterium]|nr:glycosyltransferase family 2 protein [Candidatus Omnitrophota bacterium]